MLEYKSNTSEAVKQQIWSKLRKGMQSETIQQGRANGACVQVNGEWSCGKTLFTTFIAVERNEAEGIPIVSNYNLRGLHPYYRITDRIEIIKKLRNLILIIDEIRRYMDSYLTQSKKTRFISNLAADLGKQSCDFYYTDQSPTAAPARIRNNISLIAYPRLDENTNWVTVYCFYGVTEYLMVEPFFYFGFYAPDYWWAYDTSLKIEDYKLHFQVQKYAIMYLHWIRAKQVSGVSKKTMNLWNLGTGQTLSCPEQDAVLTFLEEKGIDK